MNELSDFVEFMKPVSGDKRWHEAHVRIRERMRSDSDIGMSYAIEAGFYLSKYVIYVVPVIAAVKYLSDKF